MAEANDEINEIVEGIVNVNVGDGAQGSSAPCSKQCTFHGQMPRASVLPINDHRIVGRFDCKSSYVVYLLYCDLCQARYVGCTTSTFKTALKPLLRAMDQDRRLIDHFTSRRERTESGDSHRHALKAYIICTVKPGEYMKDLPGNADERTVKKAKNRALLRKRDWWINALNSLYVIGNEAGLNTGPPQP